MESNQVSSYCPEIRDGLLTVVPGITWLVTCAISLFTEYEGLLLAWLSESMLEEGITKIDAEDNSFPSFIALPWKSLFSKRCAMGLTFFLCKSPGSSQSHGKEGVNAQACLQNQQKLRLLKRNISAFFFDTPPYYKMCLIISDKRTRMNTIQWFPFLLYN